MGQLADNGARPHVCAASPLKLQCTLSKLVQWLLSREGGDPPSGSEQRDRDSLDSTDDESGSRGAYSGLDLNVRHWTQRSFCYLYAYDSCPAAIGDTLPAQPEESGAPPPAVSPEVPPGVPPA